MIDGLQQRTEDRRHERRHIAGHNEGERSAHELEGVGDGDERTGEGVAIALEPYGHLGVRHDVIALVGRSENDDLTNNCRDGPHAALEERPVADPFAELVPAEPTRSPSGKHEGGRARKPPRHRARGAPKVVRTAWLAEWPVPGPGTSTGSGFGAAGGATPAVASRLPARGPGT